MSAHHPLRTPADPCRKADMEPDTFLEEGARILADKLGPLGYRFAITQASANGSGGTFARAAFDRGDRSIRLWARFDRMRGVRYRVGSDELTAL